MSEDSTFVRQSPWHATIPLLRVTWSAAEAAPVEPPGQLLGVALGTPLKPGLYLLDTAAHGGTPDGSRGGFNIPILLASTPFTALGARLEPFVSEPNLFADRVDAGPTRSGVYNTLVGSLAAWKLGPHLGFGYLLGTDLPSDTTVAFASGSLRQDVAPSHGDEDYSMTGHVEYGPMFDGVARFPNGLVQRNADALNLELAALRKFDAFEAGPDTRGWLRLIVPLAPGAASALANRLVER